MTNPLFDPSNDDQNENTRDWEAEFVGEGKKYKDVATLAKSAYDKDQFIERLKAEAAEARAALKGEAKMDEFLDKLKSIQTATPTAPTGSNSANQQGENESQPNKETTTMKGLTQEDVEALLSKREAAIRETENLRLTAQKVKDAFGANYQAELKARAGQLGVTEEYLTDLAKKSPSVFLKVVGAEGKAPAPSAPHTQRNSAATTTPQGVVRNNEYYLKLRKEIGNAEFFNPKIQNQLNQDMMAQGKDFF